MHPTKTDAMRNDPAPFVAASGLAFSLSLTDANQVVQLFIGMATLGYIVHKWARFALEKRSRRRSRDASQD